MFKHEDKEFEYIVHLLSQQRDFAMGQAAALYRELMELKSQLEDKPQEPEQDSHVSI